MQDKIEKKTVIKAPRSRIWRAISDKTEFGEWFRCKFPPGPFQPGEKVHGKITYPGYENMDMTIEVVDVDPETRFSYRWHPYSKNTDDYASEPMTLVTFTLADAEGGTLLTIVETGFDKIPLHRRAEAFKSNESGWTEQVRNIERHVTTG